MAESKEPRDDGRAGRRRVPASHFSDLPSVLRMNQTFERASGHWLHAPEDGGGRRVLDLVGGNGSVLLGHNPKAVVRAAAALLKRGPANAVPFAGRPRAAELTRRLAELVGRETGRRYVCSLANSASEAVELALHHVELERRTRVAAIEEDRRRNLVLVRRQLKSQKVTPGPCFLRDVATALKLDTVRSFDEAVFELTRHAKEVARRPPVVVALTNAYHGQTLGALALSYDAETRAPFTRFGLRVEFLALDEIERLQERMKRNIEVWFDMELDLAGGLQLVARPFINIGAIVVEPVLAEGGVRPVPKAFMEALREAATKVGCPLIVDESRCGLGWTGTWLASGATGVSGDYYVLAGALGAGVAKLGALLVAEERAVEWSVRTPAPSMVGDELSSAVALAVLDELERDGGAPLRLFAERGAALQRALEAVAAEWPQFFRSVRGQGLLLGVTLNQQSDSPCPGLRLLAEQNLLGPVVAAWLFHEEGVRVLPCTAAPQTLRLQAPGTIGDAEVAKTAKAFRRVAEVMDRGDFAGLTRFLVGLERTGTSRRRYAKPAAPWVDHPYARKVAFIGHNVSGETFVDWEPSLVELPLERRDEYAERLQRIIKPTLVTRRNVVSATGEVVTLNFMALSVTSRNIMQAYQDRDVQWIVDLVRDAVERAIRLGCSVIGFGGFAAVLTHNCRDIVEDRIATTSGISFTVVAGLEATQQACRERGLDLASATVAATGVASDLSRNYALAAADVAREIVLFEAPERRPRAEGLAAEIYFQAFKRLYRDGPGAATGVARHIADTRTVRELLAKPFPAEGSPQVLGPTIALGLRAELGEDRHVKVSTDPADLRRCDVIVSGAPRGGLILRPEHLKDGPVVICDIALPASVAPEVALARPDVAVLLGGLVRLPRNPDFAVPGLPLPPGTTFGCMAETMLLGLTGIMEDYSVGQLDQIRIRKIKEIAGIHGFELGHVKNIPSM